MPIAPHKKSLSRLTPDKAKTYLSHNTYAGQRDHRPDNERRLVDKLRNGLMHTGNVALAKNGRRTYLVNGQHICSAVVETGVSCDILLQEFKVKNQSELALVYSQFDDHASRTPGALAYFYARCNGLSDDVPQSCVRMVSAAYNLVDQQFRAGANLKHNKQQRAEAVGQKVKEIEWVARIAYPRGTKHELSKSAHLRRAPVVAAMLACYGKNKAHATQYWVDVRDGAGLEKDDCAKLTREWLMKIPRIRKGIAPRVEDRKFVRSVDVYSKCILWWNAWRTEEEVQRHKPNQIPEAE